MAVNNFDQIEKLLVFPNKDSFYFVQILQRKKDHVGERLGGSNNNSRLIKAYYIRSLEHLRVHKEEMIKLAEVFNARVSINLNPRNFRKALFHLLQKLAGQAVNEDWHSAPKAFDSVCGDYHSEMDKRWLIDIDTTDTAVITQVCNTIVYLQAPITNRDYAILAIIPSKSGVHIITNPFNSAKFNEHHPDIEIHKNNPTNLFIP